MSTFQIALLPGNPKFYTFCHITLLLVFWTKDKRKRKKRVLSVSVNIFFHRFVCCIFPGNNRIIRLRTSVMLSAIPPSCSHPPKAFPIHSQQHSWVIVVVNAAGQISKQETGKSAEIIPIKWDWMMENKARGDTKGGSEVHSWSLLHTAACFDCSD